MVRLLPLCALLAAAPPLRAEPPRLELHPASLDLTGPGDRHRILVTHIDGGRRTDATREAVYASERARVATVTAAGEVHAAAFGETVVTVRVGGLTAELPVAVGNGTAGEPPSFRNDVVPLLTRLGCNQGSCHGKGAGQNGFRLSLRGSAPELDHRWLTREFAGRRAAGADAGASLLLRKASGRTPHEGGALARPDGRAYALLRGWLEAGSPGPQPGETPARKLELLPGPRSLRVGDEQQLLVRAEFAPGVWRDVTWLTRFDANDNGPIAATPGGRATALRPGATAVRAAFQGEVAAVVLTVGDCRGSG